MLTKIIDILKTGNIKNGTYYGSGEQFNPPYFIVKEESNIMGTAYRVIGHFLQGQKIFLQDYIRDEVPSLLDGIKIQDRKGNNCRLSLEEINIDLPPSDDLTISEEALFICPHPPINNN